MKNNLFIILEQPTPEMKSDKSAAHHKICGKELINYVKETIDSLGAETVITITDNVSIADINNYESVVIISSNAPLIKAETIKRAIIAHSNSKLSAIYAKDGSFPVLIADKEYFTKCNAATSTELLNNLLSVTPDKFVIEDENELICVTDRIQLCEAEKIMQKQIIHSHMKNGVTFILPDTTIIEDNVVIGADTIIYPHVYIKSGSEIGKNCTIGSQTQITASKVCDNVNIQSSVLLECFVDEGTTIGPFAYIRPNTKVGKKARIGDFVELKNSNIGDGTKVSHLTYVGDSDVGKRVNFGCGTVTVNYDGKKKYRTTIGDDCFIGCNTNLVAPVTVENGGYTAAGSTITDLVPENALAIARARQVNKTDWKDRRK